MGSTHTFSRIAVGGVVVALFFVCSRVSAADPTGYETRRYEVAPFLGFRLGGDFMSSDGGQHLNIDSHASFGLAFGLRTDDVTQYELFYARQATTLSPDTSPAATGIVAEYLQFGGTVMLGDGPRIKPYLLGGLGVARFSPDSYQGHASTHFAASLGAGLRVPFNQAFALRLEARGYVALVNSDSAFFCSSDQSGSVCLVRARGSTITQLDLLAGIAYQF